MTTTKHRTFTLSEVEGQNTEQKVLITGCARSGTSLLLYLMRYFDNTVIVEEEINPFMDLSNYKNSVKRLVIKCPQGQQMGDRKRALGDFKIYDQVKTLQDVIDLNFKIIILIRDGRDVLVSKHYISQYYWVTSPRWIHAINNSLKYQSEKYSNNILFLRFENFVAETEANLNKISKFIGSDYSQDYKNHYIHINPHLDIAKAMNQPRPISSDNIGNWKQPEHQDRMRYLVKKYGESLSDLLIQLGYENNHDWVQQYL